MKLQQLTQGTKEWHEFRATHFTASDAAAMLNLSPYKTRNQLLHEKATGETEVITPQKQALFDKGHQAEELARHFSVERLGEDLFPATATSDEREEIACSFDGVTMLEDVTWEHKLFNQKLVDYINEHDDLPDTHWPQVEQGLYVSGAEKCLFTTSDGTEDNRLDFEYVSHPERMQRVLDGWTQFAKDLATYEAKPEKAAVVVEEVSSLPALSFDLNKTTLAIASNMDEYKAKALALVEESKQPLQTESDFGRAEKIVKEFKAAESKLGELKDAVLGEVQSVNAFISDVDEIRELIRQARLATDKQVKTKKTEIKNSILSQATTKVTEMYAAVNGEFNTQVSCADIGKSLNAAIKGKSNLDRIQDAVDGVVAEYSIELENTKARIVTNLEVIKANADYRFLFNDWTQIAEMLTDNFAEMAESRISQHKAQEAARIEMERIEADRKAKAKAEAEAAQERARIEQKAAQEKRELEAKVQAEREAKEAAERKAQQAAEALASHTPSAPPCEAKPTIKQSPEEVISITVGEYKALLHARAELETLKAYGVESWSGYAEAMGHVGEAA